jgi:hypothetical protein
MLSSILLFSLASFGVALPLLESTVVAQAAAPEQDGRQALRPPEGRWVWRSKEERVEQWFFPGGAWGFVQVREGQRRYLHGTWKSEGQELLLTTDRGKALPLRLWKLEGQKLLLSRKGKPESVNEHVAAPFADKRILCDSWVARWGEGSGRDLRLLPDGSFESMLLMHGQIMLSREGTWTQKGLRLLLVDRISGAKESFDWTLGPKARLELTKDGATQIYLSRSRIPVAKPKPKVEPEPKPKVEPEPKPKVEPQPKPKVEPEPEPKPEPDAPRLPAEFLGSWKIEDDTGSARLDLSSDTHFRLELVSFGKKRSFAGVARFAEGKLTLEDPKLEKPIVLPVRRIGEKLGLEFNGTELELERL